MTNPYRIAVYPGDGIGPEVIAEALRVLQHVAKLERFDLQFTQIPWGYAYWRESGQVVPPDYLEQLALNDAILLGALGWPPGLPDHVSLPPLLEIRQRFEQYASMRPARLYAGVPSVLAGKGPADVDILVVRENSEGEYVDNGGRFRRGAPDEFALQTAIHTRPGIERILRFGFQQARTRRHHLTMVTKSNALRYGMVLWDEVFEDVRVEYPEIESTKQHVDAVAMNFVRCPDQFDVVVCSNLFGDILTDLGGMIAGGLGLAPSSNINPEKRWPSMFEPVHGSAPDIAGQGRANPVAAVLSAAMLIEFLGESSAALRMRRAVEAALVAGSRTVDLGGTLSTREMGDAILKQLETNTWDSSTTAKD